MDGAPTRVLTKRIGNIELKMRKASATRRRRFEERLASALERPHKDWDASLITVDSFVRIPWADIRADPARFARFLEKHGPLDAQDSRGHVFTIHL